jgi:hypothetical protein
MSQKSLNPETGKWHLSAFLFIAMTSIGPIAPATRAQTQGTVSNPSKKVRNQLNITVDTDSSDRPIERLKSSVSTVQKEIEEITGLLKTVTDDCQKEELRLRLLDAQFLRNNAKQIEDIIGFVQRGLKLQATLLQNFAQGLVEGEALETFTYPNGETVTSAIIEFKDEEEGKPVRRRIPLVSLVRYIALFEAEAAKTKDTKEAADALIARFKDSHTQNDPAFFYMTLNQAVKAYQERLNSVIQRSSRVMNTRNLVIGSGRSLFRITTLTTLGYDPVYRTTVGSMLTGGAMLTNSQKSQNGVTLALVQNYGEALKQASENRYWEIIRSQQLTIDGIPVDGYLRRMYFDAMRSRECQKGGTYTFNANSDPGPYLSYQNKVKCEKFGMEILAAVMEKTKHHDGKVPVGTIFDLTKKMATIANGQSSISSPNGFYSIVSELGMGSCDDVRMRVSYRCGCEARPREKDMHYKLGRTLGFGCD